MKEKQYELKAIYIAIVVLFAIFLIVPIGALLMRSFQDGGFTLANYSNIFATDVFYIALKNSLFVSSCAAILSVLFGFVLAFANNYTRLYKPIKKALHAIATMPMLLPSITYGFAILYSLGKQGLLVKLLGYQPFEIYGFNGLLIGYVIYTLPISYTLINNAMKYIDKKYITVSVLLKDSPFQTFKMTLLRPLIATLAAAFIQSFFLSFTDFGIPASLGGKYDVISSLLYTFMLGSIPNFAKGAVIAMVMLIPSIISISLLHYLEKFNVRYHKVSIYEIKKNKVRDIITGISSILICLGVLSIFVVIFAMPFVKQWPYRMEFTLEHVSNVFQDPALIKVFQNSLIVAVLTAMFGTLIAYGAALVSCRSKLNKLIRKSIESMALITNTIPGMVIGISYLFVFSGTSLQNTFPLIIVCNIVHFFSTPYLLMSESLKKMNASFETTAKLMKDKWIHTLVRVITPNALPSLFEVFSYYFVNAMVTISAIIFIAGARTMVITTKIKELQYFGKYNEIFVLSLLILFTNIVAKRLFSYLIDRNKKVKGNN
ncbi:MAG: ABC transporter permease subunit [Erysipelotrichia bacterium]|nr:ABC transporter permease subunit [Erysipelotrichia bacterium]